MVLKLLTNNCGIICKVVFSVRRNPASGPSECELGTESKIDTVL